MTLPNPWPSSPTRPPRCSITAVRIFEGEQHARVHTQCFAELYAAKHWLHAMVGNVSGTLRGNELLLDDGIKLRSYELDKIMAYELKGDEEKWKLPEDCLRLIARFRRGTWEQPAEPIVTEVELAPSKKKTKKATTVKETIPTGFVTITELCRGTPVTPMTARGLLRAANYAKPSYGWAFGPKDVPAIRKLIGLL